MDRRILLAGLILVIILGGWMLMRSSSTASSSVPSSLANFMYGPWIRWNQQQMKVQKEAKLKDGTRVFMIQDGIYIKMVTEKGDGKYFEGTLDQFTPDKWDTYSDAGKGNYNLRVCSQPCVYGCAEDQKTCLGIDLPAGVPIIHGYPAGTYIELGAGQSPEECRQKAFIARAEPATAGVVVWGHRNTQHGVPTLQNSCYGFTSMSPAEDNPSDTVHISGCMNPGVTVQNACK